MTTTTIKLSSPADIIAVIPYQLGFHPQRCIVTINMNGARMGLIQRIDIPDPEHLAVAMDAMIDPMRQANPTSVILIGYEEELGECLPALSLMTEIVTLSGYKLVDSLVVRDGRWFSRTCTNKSCCPPEGTPLPVAARSVVAEFVGRGVAPHDSRSRLVASVQAGPDALHVPAATEVTTEAVQVWRSIISGGDVTPRQAREAASSLCVVDWRDALIAYMNPGTLNLDLVSPEMQALIATLPEITLPVNAVTDRLIGFVSKLDSGAAPALSVLAAYTWHNGDGALTRIALDRALGCDPDYRLAQLQERMVDLCIRPEKTLDGPEL